MKSPSYRDILAATHLTRAGNLAQATRLLQDTLRGVGAPATSSDDNTNPDLVVGRSSLLSGANFWNVEKAPGCIASGSSQNGANGVRISSHPVQEKLRGRFLTQSFSSAEGSRAYKLYVPSLYDGQPCPLIVMLHGCTQSPDDFAAGTRMNELAEKQMFLVAYPEQATSANALRCWNWFETGNQQRDRGEPLLVAGITRQIMHKYAIDCRRVYVAGMSAGAAAAAVLGGTYPDIYAAVGVHSGLACGLAQDVPSAFAVMRSGEGVPRIKRSPHSPENDVPIATIVFHGDRDTTVNKANGDRFADDLSTPAYAKRIEAGRAAGGRAYTKTVYTDASGRCVLEQWSVHGAGHAWSGGSAVGSYTDVLGPDASREMVRFFFSHRLAE